MIKDIQQFLPLIQSKKGGENQLVFCSLLLFFEKFCRFPNQDDSLGSISDLCNALALEKIDHTFIDKKVKDSASRTIKRYKSEIRIFFQFRQLNYSTMPDFVNFLTTNVLPRALKKEQVMEEAYAYLKEQKIEVRNYSQIEHVLKIAHHQFETDLFEKIESALPLETKDLLDKLIREEYTDQKIPKITFGELKENKAHLKIDSILFEVKKYKALSHFKIPENIQLFGSRPLFLKYFERVLSESPSHIRQHKSPIRYAYLVIFCFIQKQLITDILTDLLLKLLHKIQTKAESAVDKALRFDNKRVKGKMGTLLALAKQSITYPDDMVRNVIFPKASKERLIEIVTELGEDGQWYKNQVKTKAISLYNNNNRRIIWAILDVLELGANSKFQPILKALNFVRKLSTGSYEELKTRFYDPIFLKKLIPDHWHPFVKIKTVHPTKIQINWNVFELALFEILEKELPIKNIWISGAYRYRNPDDDMPHDFDEREDYYFDLLGIPKDADTFIQNLKTPLEQGLSDLNDSILTNPKVIIKDRKKQGSIKITPFAPQDEPQNIESLKLEIANLWPNLHLIDILKEADYRIGFTKRFESVATREAINENNLRKRLLLCIFGLGCNTGLKRMSGLIHCFEKYDDLRYVKKRFINCQNVRFAIQDVVNAIQSIRDPKIWGSGTTSCASDSKKVSVFDQNLMVEWHARYGGRGVMIYWHVDKKGLCIHSKIKTCSSSEVGAMLHGILHHDTEMDINQISVDTHGQSSIGFAFSELFGFDLLPHIKNINTQKLYCSSRNKKNEYSNLTDALAFESIKWNKIKSYYREVVKLAVALKLRTVEPDVLIKRLSADNKDNPLYQALMEIGKVSRTIFLCKYISSEALRMDIHEALNVVERVNGIMGFIFYGRLGEISTNNTNDQELSLLCLHLLQVCMVYINTILIQTTLSDPKWKSILKPDDMRALSPLFHGHINPYGLLSLDMLSRLNIETHLYIEPK